MSILKSALIVLAVLVFSTDGYLILLLFHCSVGLCLNMTNYSIKMSSPGLRSETWDLL